MVVMTPKKSPADEEKEESVNKTASASVWALYSVWCFCVF